MEHVYEMTHETRCYARYSLVFFARNRNVTHKVRFTVSIAYGSYRMCWVHNFNGNEVYLLYQKFINFIYVGNFCYFCSSDYFRT